MPFTSTKMDIVNGFAIEDVNDIYIILEKCFKTVFYMRILDTYRQ
jgi:hypothetical protein